MISAEIMRASLVMQVDMALSASVALSTTISHVLAAHETFYGQPVHVKNTMMLESQRNVRHASIPLI